MTAPSRSIPFFNYPALFQERRGEYMAVIEDVLARGAYIMQRDLAEFEAGLASFLGVGHAFGVADGTMALTMSLRAAGIGPGDEVIVPSHTFVASAAAIRHTGAIPVLVDCGRDHLIDAAKAEEAVSERTAAIMPVQLNGRTADMDAVGALADRHGLKIVEDSCQALGSKFKGRFAGTFGVAGSFSFYPAKTLGCFGDGGGLVTDDPDAAATVRLMRDHGRDETGTVRLWGHNGRLDNVQAAVLALKLRHYADDIDRRRALARRYDERLRDVAELLLPPGPDAGGDHFDIFQNYEIEADDRDGLRAHLDAHGVKTILQWGGQTIHMFKDLDFRVGGDLSYTERMVGRFMLLPMNTTLADDDVDYICDVIRDFYGR